MFFTNDVLVASGGKFSIIWLAATRKSRLKRKDCQNVDIIKVCDELQKRFKPRSDGRMTSVKEDASLSVQSLHKFQSQLQLYPLTFVGAPTSLPSSSIQDPMFGKPPIDVSMGPGYLTQVSSDNFSDDSILLHCEKEKLQGNFSVKDLSTITMPDEIQKPLTSFADEEQLLAGDQEQLVGSGLISDMIFGFGDAAMPGELTAKNKAANITTPAAALQKSITTPARPSKSRPSSPTFSKTSEETLAIPLFSPKTPDSGRRQNQEEKAFSEVHQFIDEGKTESSLTVEPEPKSNASSDLILMPISEKKVGRQRSIHAHSSLIVDKKIELNSDYIRNQLSTPLNSIENYMNEGNFDVLPNSVATSKQLFEQATSTLLESIPGCMDPFKGSSKKHFFENVPISAPQLLFSDIIEELDSNLKFSSKSRFSAHKLMAKTSMEFIHPEDEYEAMSDGPPLLNETGSTMTMAGDDTFATDHSSIPRFRDTSRLSLMPHSLGESDQVGAMENLDQTHLQSENASFLYQSDLVEPGPVITTSQNIAATELGHMAISSSETHVTHFNFIWLLNKNIKVLLDNQSEMYKELIIFGAPSAGHVDKLSKSTITKQKINKHWSMCEKLGLHDDDDEVTFSSLAPPSLTLRHQAAEIFFNILMLAKNSQVSVRQEEAFKEIFLRKSITTWV